MINKKCNCENEVSGRKLAVPIISILWKSSTCGNKKNRGPYKVEALKKWLYQKVAVPQYFV